jgi:hypothetical protein
MDETINIPLTSIEEQVPVIDPGFAALSSIYGDDISTLHPLLTGDILSALSATNYFENIQVITNMLSAFNALPTDPWDQEKYKAFGTDYINYTPITLSSIEVPEDFDLKESALTIGNISNNFSKIVCDEIINCMESNSLSASESIQLLENIHFTSLSATPNGEVRVFDNTKHRNYVEFVEFIMNMDITNIPEDDLLNTAKKIVYTFSKVF